MKPMMTKALDHDLLHRYATDKRRLLVATDGVEIPAEGRVLRQNVDRERDQPEDDGRQGNAAVLVAHEHEQQQQLRAVNQRMNSDSPSTGTPACARRADSSTASPSPSTR